MRVSRIRNPLFRGLIVYVLDPKTGKQRKRITARGNEITDLAGAPNAPYVYAATSTYDVFSINTETGQPIVCGVVGIAVG